MCVPSLETIKYTDVCVYIWNVCVCEVCVCEVCVFVRCVCL